jgi:hypothetical protein
MQRRLLLVLGLLGAIAGLALILALYFMGGRTPRLPDVQAPPPVVPRPPDTEVKAERRSGTLEGRVVNGLTREGIPRAKVAALTPHLEPAKAKGEIPRWGGLLEKKAILTGAEGRFALTDLPPDYWNLWVEKEGYAWTTVPRAQFDTTHEIELFPACSVTGKVLLPDGSPASGVRIEYHVQGTHSEVFSRYKLESYYMRTGEDGSFLYADLPPGKFTIEVYPEDYLPAPWRFEPPLEPGENRDLGIHKLDDGFSLLVHVRYRETNEPVAGVEVIVRPVADPMPRTNIGQRRRTAADGTARFKGIGGQVVPNPKLLVTANVNGEPVLPDEGGMHAPGSEVTIYLRKEGAVKGQVIRPNGQPLETFGVDLEAQGHITRQLRDVGENGAFAVYRVPGGRYVLRVRYGNLVEKAIEIEVKGGEELDVGVIRLEEGAQIAGIVRRSNGKELGEVVRVNLGRKVRSPTGQEIWEEVKKSYCLEDGSYVLKGIAPGSYWLWPEAIQTPTGTTDPVPIEVPPGVASLEQPLVLHAEGFLDLKFMDRHEGSVIHVAQPPTYLIEAATGREIQWMGVGTRLRPGAYTVLVELPDAQGVPRRYTAGEFQVREREKPGQDPKAEDPIEIRLFEIRDGS